jgi:PPOX class probable F420-dependent enzyme
MWNDRTMFSSEARALLKRPVTGVVTCTDPKGYPQSTAVWFLFDDEAEVIRISMTTGRKKYRNMVASPKASFFVLNPDNVWSFVEVRADVTWEADDDRLTMRRVGEYYSTDVTGFDPAGAVRVTAVLTPVVVNAR